MDFLTKGKQYNTDTVAPVKCIKPADFNNNSIGECYRMILIESGAGILTVNGNKLLFDAPSVFCLNEKEYISLDKQKDIKAYCVYFKPQEINSSLNFENIILGRSEMSPTQRNDSTSMSPFYTRTDKYHGHLCVDLQTFKRMLILFKRLDMELDVQPDYFWPCRSRSFLIELLFTAQNFFLDLDTDTEIILNSTSQDIDEILLYLHSNYDKQITINELSRLFNINRTTLNNKFKEAFSITIISYLIHLRTRLASMMLRDTMIPISEIAERVGFNDTAHFNRTFKKIVCVTPSDYRQQNNWLIN
jgi:AraC family L-rhamnose operon regulatory protein RhaS